MIQVRKVHSPTKWKSQAARLFSGGAFITPGAVRFHSLLDDPIAAELVSGVDRFATVEAPVLVTGIKIYYYIGGANQAAR